MLIHFNNKYLLINEIERLLHKRADITLTMSGTAHYGKFHATLSVKMPAETRRHPIEIEGIPKC